MNDWWETMVWYSTRKYFSRYWNFQISNHYSSRIQSKASSDIFSFKPFFIPLVNPAKKQKKKAFEIGSRKNRIGENVIYFKWNIGIKWITILLQYNIIHSFYIWLNEYTIIDSFPTRLIGCYYVSISSILMKKQRKSLHYSCHFNE